MILAAGPPADKPPADDAAGPDGVGKTFQKSLIAKI
jgi:hypothetical protein